MPSVFGTQEDQISMHIDDEKREVTLVISSRIDNAPFPKTAITLNREALAFLTGLMNGTHMRFEALDYGGRD